MKQFWTFDFGFSFKEAANKKFLFIALCAALIAFCSSVAEGQQQPSNFPRVGLLLPWSPASAVSLSFLKAFREGLYEAGYVKGRNLTIEHRYAQGVSERFPELAAELVRLNVDIIVTTAGPPSRAAKLATNTIPIVFTQVTDPVAEGLVASLARPGGNITGLSQVGPELAGKRLELLKESFPKISRIAVLRTSGSPPSPSSKKRDSRQRRWVLRFSHWSGAALRKSMVHSRQQ